MEEPSWSKHRVNERTNLSVPISCEGCPIGACAIYAPAFRKDPGSITALRRAQRILDPRHTIIREGQILKEVYTLFSGWAYRFTLFGDGRRQIFSFLLPGDFITYQCMAGSPAPFSITTITPVALCVFDPLEMAEFLVHSREQVEYLCQISFNHAAAVDRRLAAIGRRSAIGRIAQLLLELHTRLSKRGLVNANKFALPLRQEHIADALGLTTIYVNRTLARLRNQRVISFRREEMEILDLSRLRELAGEG